MGLTTTMEDNEKRKLKEVNRWVVLTVVEMQLVMTGADEWIDGR